MSDNMKLWNELFTTDPRAVKAITGKPYKGNSPKPFWIIQRATEVFGPVGIGWGVKVKNERFERMTDTDVLHVATVEVWYVLDGVRSDGWEQMGGTKAAYMAKSGMIVDEDAGKKSVTDAMVKCFSMAGFAGDIFSGRWDDSGYVAEARKHYAAKEGEQTDALATPKEISEGVMRGDASGAASYLAGLSQDDLDSIWSVLETEIQTQLTAAWPKD